MNDCLYNFRHAHLENILCIDRDIDRGMAAAGRIIRDAWAIGVIPETGR